MNTVQRRFVVVRRTMGHVGRGVCLDGVGAVSHYARQGSTDD